MHPVLGTMMPEVCEAPHLHTLYFTHHVHLQLGGMRSLHFLKIYRLPNQHVE